MCANLDAMLAGGGAAGLAALLTGLKDIRPEARVRLKVRAAAPLHPSPPHLARVPCGPPCLLLTFVFAHERLPPCAQVWLFQRYFASWSCQAAA